MNEIDRPMGFHALTDAQKAAHRGKIAIRVRSILGQFWRDDVPDAVEAMEREAWVATLETLSHDELLAAWVLYQRQGPRSERGILIKPDAGALYRIAMEARPRPALRSIPARAEAPRSKIAPHRVTEIMAEVYGNDRAGEGLLTPKPKRFGGE
jgi:hypothetical protein